MTTRPLLRGAGQTAAVVALFVGLHLGVAALAQGLPESPIARQLREVQGAAFQAGEALGLARGRVQGFVAGGLIIAAGAAALHLRREARRAARRAPRLEFERRR